MKIEALAAIALCCSGSAQGQRATDYEDPRIGSEGLGRVFVGPALPFGMVRPGPDCTPEPNSGWLPMPARVDGFSQTHVSGTGGGAKYGNILVQPFLFAAGGETATEGGGAPLTQEGWIGAPQQRRSESIELGRYGCTYQNGITTAVSATGRASIFEFEYPERKGDESAGEATKSSASGAGVASEGAQVPALLVDCGFFLGRSPIPEQREAQMLVGSEIEVVNDTSVCGYSRVRGGWNNGRAYTMYFYATTSEPFTARTFRGTTLSDAREQADHGDATGAILSFGESTRRMTLRVGVSFLSELRARENLREVEGKRLAQVQAQAVEAWDSLLSRVEIAAESPDSVKRMFYTALYHTLLMPTDRTGENPLWNDPGVPYYDDYYAIWDTYRSSSPLLTLLDPGRQADIVNSLVNIGRREGYMPDARAGNDNGRTQGGSNADIVIADAYVKGLEGIDYEAAYRAMVRDAEVDPGARHEAEGRGGLEQYKALGYVPFGVARAGNRTVEYSLCDYAVAQVAEGLGYAEDARKYGARSHSWRNLWRGDYIDDGFRGFIMPRDSGGEWVDSIPFGHGPRLGKFEYKPTMFEGPWYKPWWEMFFYEASSWEYSLSMPHDVEALINSCGGAATFERRLDRFFERPYFNVNNEPSFLTPMLYHWIGRPDKSSERVRAIIAEHYSDTPGGLPGNDDAGATSSWLAWHIVGLYPNAGHPYYLIHTPLTRSATFRLANGRSFTIEAPGLTEEKQYIVGARLNGERYPYSTISHSEVMRGGKLTLEMGEKPTTWGQEMMPAGGWPRTAAPEKAESDRGDTAGARRQEHVADFSTGVPDTFGVNYMLHGQHRRFRMSAREEGDGGLTLRWSIVRNLQPWRGEYRMTGQALKGASEVSWLMPEDGLKVTLPADQLFLMVSEARLRELKEQGRTRLNGIDFELDGGNTPKGVVHARAENAEGTEIWVLDNPRLPLIMRMERNPWEINWVISR